MASVTTTSKNMPKLVMEKLLRMRSKLTRWVLIHGLGRWLIVILAILAFDVALDRFFKMDFAQRVVMLIAMAVTAAAYFGVRVLKPLLAENTGGKVVVRISYTCANGETGLLDLGEDWRIRVDSELLGKLVDVFGEENLFYHYSQEALAQHYPAKPSYRQRAAAFG